MSIADYKVKALIYPNGEYRLSKPAKVIDEGSFYRIDGTHIFDKYKIQTIELIGDKLSIVMTDKTVVLEIEV